MADPLSITASIIAVLSAVKSVYDAIDRVAKAPEVLTKASADLKDSGSVLEALRRYAEGSTETQPEIQGLINEKSSLASVLARHQKLCKDFREKLRKAFDHFEEGGKLDWTDQIFVSLKQTAIQQFREEISRNTAVISLRVDIIVL